MIVYKRTGYLIGVLLAASLWANVAHAVIYAGSCEFEPKPILKGVHSQEKKSRQKVFLWVYNSAWGHGTEMRTSLGNAVIWRLDDNNNIEHLGWGAAAHPTPPNPAYSIDRNRPTKAIFVIDSGVSRREKYLDDCKHWECQSSADLKCADPTEKWLL